MLDGGLGGMDAGAGGAGPGGRGLDTLTIPAPAFTLLFVFACTGGGLFVVFVPFIATTAVGSPRLLSFF